MFCFIVPSFLSWGSDISAFNIFTLQKLKLFISRVMLEWLPCLAQCSMNATVQLADESTVWGTWCFGIHPSGGGTVSQVFPQEASFAPTSDTGQGGEGWAGRQHHEHGCPGRHWGHQSQKHHLACGHLDYFLSSGAPDLMEVKHLSVKLSLKSNWVLAVLPPGRDWSCGTGACR